MADELDDLIQSFSLFDNWEDRYSYIIDLGKRLEHMEETVKTPATKVEGCTAQVWLISTQNEEKRYHFIADSDAAIVRGLIYILLLAYNEKTAEEISAVDIKESFSQLGLDQHLSPNRRNGFFAMVERIKALASS